ncbi:unnamed protein product [Closterium sp. NIES-64]|nr:unnamed protein product [Closterium sp. NIES-64]
MLSRGPPPPAQTRPPPSPSDGHAVPLPLLTALAAAPDGPAVPSISAPPLHPTAPPSPLPAPPLLQTAPPLPLPAPLLHLSAPPPQQPSRSSSRAAPVAEPPLQLSRPSSRAAPSRQPCRPSRPSRRVARAAQQPRRRGRPSRPSPPCTALVLTFDAEGRAIDFDVWVDDLLLFLQCDRADGLSLFDLTSGASPAPAATEDATVRSQWATRDAAARLAVRRHLPPAERAYFGRLMLPYLFPDLAAFATVADLITHLRTGDARFRAALPAEFCAKNPPPPITSLSTTLSPPPPDSLRGVRDDLLAVCPTTLTVELLEKSLLAAEKSILAVGASRGDPRTPILRGVPPPPSCPLSPLLLRPTLLVLSRSVRRLPPAGDVALARARGAGALVEAAGAVEAAGEAAEEVRVVAGVVAGVEVSAEAVEAGAAAAVVVGVKAEAAVAAATVGVAVAAEVVAAAAEEAAEVVARRGGVAPVVFTASSSSVVRRPSPRSSSVSGTLHVSGVGVLVRALTSCALATVREGDCYRCFPPDPGIGTAALGAVEATAPGAGEAVALGASESESSGAGESALSGCRGDQFTPARRRVTHCTDADTGRHLTTFTRGPGSSLYTLTVPSPPPASGQVAASGQVFATAPRMGHPSLPLLRAWSLAFSSLAFSPSLPPLPPGPGPPCVPCVEGRLRATPHSSPFPPTEAPMQTLHMDVWGPARVRGQGHERYFLLVVDDYSRYTTVFPSR